MTGLINRTQAIYRDANHRCWLLAALCIGFIVCMALVGCNSARVVRSNIERTAQNKGQPKERPWPVHPHAPAKWAAPRYQDTHTPTYAPREPAPEDNDGIIQAAAESPSAWRAERVVSSRETTVSGRVVDSNGRAQRNVSVVATATRRPGSPRVEATTDANGHFVLRGLESGQRYLILASAIRNTSSLIGRVSAIPPDQGVVIEIAPPFTAKRQATHASQPERTALRPEAHVPQTGTGRRSLHSQNPFADELPRASHPSSATHPTEGPRSALPSRKLTREQASAENRMTLPWDTPAPSTRRSPPTVRNSEPQATSHAPSASPWKPAGEFRFEPLTPRPSHSLPQRTDPETAQAPPKPEDDQPVPQRRTGTVNPRQPLSQPIEIADKSAAVRPYGTAVADSAADLENSATESETSELPYSKDLPVYDGPMCELDGDRLVDFQLQDVQGRSVTFSSLNGRLILVDFWTTWCGPCLKAIPHLVNLQKRYGSQGLRVIGIACEQGQADERLTRVSEIRSHLGVNYPLLLDEGNDKFLAQDKFRVKGYPTLILLDKTGRVLWRSEAPDHADLQQLEKLLKAQLSASSR